MGHQYFHISIPSHPYRYACRRSRFYLMVCPPCGVSPIPLMPLTEMIIDSPLMYEQSELARNETTLEMSLAVPRRPMGVPSRNCLVSVTESKHSEPQSHPPWR